MNRVCSINNKPDHQERKKRLGIINCNAFFKYLLNLIDHLQSYFFVIVQIVFKEAYPLNNKQ